MTMDQIDPVTSFQSSSHGQDLVRRQVGRMERQAQVVVLHQGKEPERAVLQPLNQRSLGIIADHCLDEGGRFSNDVHAISHGCQQSEIVRGRSRHGFGGVVKQVDVARSSRGIQDLVERGPARYVAFAVESRGGEETANASLECCESHCLSLLARRNSSRRPYRST